jgi:hypothetical protein
VRGISGEPLPPEVLWEAVAASLLLIWRVSTNPLPAWRDWWTILCAFWLFAALASRTRAWPYVTGAVMAGLLLLYGWGQIPLTLAALGLGP